MSFKNEFIPPLEQETSAFFKKARETLKTGHSEFDIWTVDREREMVLLHKGSGREVETADEQFWGFLDQNGYCIFDTKKISKSQISSDEISVTFELKGFWGGKNTLLQPSELFKTLRKRYVNSLRGTYLPWKHINAVSCD